MKDDEFAHHFRYYDAERKAALNGRTHIITIELSKLERIAHKLVGEMTSLERWAVFFRYTHDKEKRELVNEIIKIEEGIAMAGQVLLTISKDENERARLTGEYKFAVDLQSKIVDARRAGRQEGRQEVAMRMLSIGMEIEQISKVTGLSTEEIKCMEG